MTFIRVFMLITDP